MDDSPRTVPPTNIPDLSPRSLSGADALPGPTPLPGTNTTPTPHPTPNPANSAWVQQRLDAVIAIYGLTPEGAALVRSLDVRQMEGEPGFLGSYGFKKWTGIGEAKPIGVIHELSHSSWGGFPVTGLPELIWDKGVPSRAAIERSENLRRRHYFSPARRSWTQSWHIVALGANAGNTTENTEQKEGTNFSPFAKGDTGGFEPSDELNPHSPFGSNK